MGYVNKEEKGNANSLELSSNNKQFQETFVMGTVKSEKKYQVHIITGNVLLLEKNVRNKFKDTFKMERKI